MSTTNVQKGGGKRVEYCQSKASMLEERLANILVAEINALLRGALRNNFHISCLRYSIEKKEASPRQMLVKA
jgi:hypothetical protein